MFVTLLLGTKRVHSKGKKELHFNSDRSTYGNDLPFYFFNLFLFEFFVSVLIQSLKNKRKFLFISDSFYCAYYKHYSHHRCTALQFKEST